MKQGRLELCGDVRFHHLGFVVRDALASQQLTASLGDEVDEERSGPVAAYKCYCSFLKHNRIEIVYPTSNDSPLSHFAASRGGLHHIAFQVPDLRRFMDTAGIHLTDPEPISGAGNLLVNFIHPVYFGIILEIVEEPKK